MRSAVLFSGCVMRFSKAEPHGFLFLHHEIGDDEPVISLFDGRLYVIDIATLTVVATPMVGGGCEVLSYF